MRRYLAALQERNEEEQSAKRRRVSENQVNGRSLLQQQYLPQRQQCGSVQQRDVQNSRRGKNVRLEDPCSSIVEYLDKQITNTKQLLAQMDFDNIEEEEKEEETFDIMDVDIEEEPEEQNFKRKRNMRAESSNSIMLRGLDKPTPAMQELLARKQLKSTPTLDQSVSSTTELNTTFSIDQFPTRSQQYKSEPMQVETKTRGRRTFRMAKMDLGIQNDIPTVSVPSIKKQLYKKEQQTEGVVTAKRGTRKRDLSDSTTSQNIGKLTPAMLEILARKQQQPAAKQGHIKKLDQSVSSTTELNSTFLSDQFPTQLQQYKSEPMEVETKIRGRRTTRMAKVDDSIQNYISAVSVPSLKKQECDREQQTVEITAKKVISKRDLSDSSTSQNIGKLTPAMQEILARKQQQTAAKQGQTKKLDQSVSSTAELNSTPSTQQLLTQSQQYKSKPMEVETKTRGRRTTRMAKVNTGIQNDISTVSVMCDKEQQTEEEVLTAKRGTSKRQKQTNTRTLLTEKEAQTKNESVKVEIKRDEVGSSASQGNLTPAMQEILARKQQKAESKQTLKKPKINHTERNELLNADVLENGHSTVSAAPQMQTDVTVGVKGKRGTAATTKGRPKSSVRKEQSDVSSTTQSEERAKELLQTTTVAATRGRGRRTVLQKQTNTSTLLTEKEAQTKNESVKVEIKRDEVDSSASQGNLTPAMQGILARKQQKAESKLTLKKTKINNMERHELHNADVLENEHITVSTAPQMQTDVTVAVKGKRSTAATTKGKLKSAVRKEQSDVSSTTQNEECAKELHTTTVAVTRGRGRRAVLTEDLHTPHSLGKRTSAMQQLLAKKNKSALEKMTKGK